MRRFFVEEINTEDGSFVITGSEAKHITRVLRMGRGDRFILMDNTGARFEAVIKSSAQGEVLVTLEKPLPGPPRSPVEIILCQALLKSGPMDTLIQKTSELGVARIIPFASARTVAMPREDRLTNRMRHWREIARSAAKQADRHAPAHIGSLQPFPDLMRQWDDPEVLKVILWEKEGSRDLKSILRVSVPGSKFVGFVGPEGGFSREEMAITEEAGGISVSLGQRILRAETAAITLVAIVQYEWGDLSLNYNTPPNSAAPPSSCSILKS